MKTLQIIKQKTHAHVSVLMMPIVPYMNDSYDNLKAIYDISSRIGVEAIIPGTMYLRGKTKTYFLNYMKNYDDDLYQQLSLFYSNKEVKYAYKKELYQKINLLRKEYKI